MQKCFWILVLGLFSSAVFAGMAWQPIELRSVSVPLWSDFAMVTVGTIICLAAYRVLRKRQ